jgi:hypothetical protein
MSKVINNALLQGVSGKLGETHYYRMLHGKLQMCNLPGERKKSTARQKVQMKRFRAASQWAKAETRDAAVKAHYATGICRERPSAYNVALSDYLNAPVIHYIRPKLYTGTVGSLITIKATDDFRVERVYVTIHTAEGKLLESGEAERNKRKPFMWNYRATVKNAKVSGSVIQVNVWDRPDNMTEGQLVIGQ